MSVRVGWTKRERDVLMDEDSGRREARHWSGRGNGEGCARQAGRRKIWEVTTQGKKGPTKDRQKGLWGWSDAEVFHKSIITWVSRTAPPSHLSSSGASYLAGCRELLCGGNYPTRSSEVEGKQYRREALREATAEAEDVRSGQGGRRGGKADWCGKVDPFTGDSIYLRK